MVDDHDIKSTWQAVSNGFMNWLKTVAQKLQQQLLPRRGWTVHDFVHDKVFGGLHGFYNKTKQENSPEFLIASVRSDGPTKEVCDIPNLTLADCADLSNKLRDAKIENFAISVRIEDPNNQLMQMLNLSANDKNKLIGLQNSVSRARTPEIQDQKQDDLIKWICKKVNEKSKDNPNILKYIKCTVTANRCHMQRIEEILEGDPILSKYSFKDRAREEARERLRKESKKCVEKIRFLDTSSKPTLKEFKEMEGNFGNVASLNSPVFKEGYYCMKMDVESFSRLRFKDDEFADKVIKNGDKFPIVATHRTDGETKDEVHIYIPVMVDKEGNRENSNLESFVEHIDKLGMSLANDCVIQEFSTFNQGMYNDKNEKKLYTIECGKDEHNKLVPMKDQEQQLGAIANVLHDAGYKTSIKVRFENYAEGETVPSIQLITDCSKQKVDELVHGEVKKKVAASKEQGLEASENIRLLQHNIIVNKRNMELARRDKKLMEEFNRNGGIDAFTNFTKLFHGITGGSLSEENER